MSNHYGVTSTGRVPGPVIEQLREQLEIAKKANGELEAENARVKLERDEARAASLAARRELVAMTARATAARGALKDYADHARDFGWENLADEIEQRMRTSSSLDRFYKVSDQAPVTEEEADEVLKEHGIDADASFARLQEKIRQQDEALAPPAPIPAQEDQLAALRAENERLREAMKDQRASFDSLVKEAELSKGSISAYVVKTFAGKCRDAMDAALAPRKAAEKGK
jgi:hypothetical protein